MRYCLVYYNESEMIEITGYANYKEDKIYNEKKLQDIVNFTNQFENETILESYLMYKTNFNPTFVGTFGIASYKNNSFFKILPYGISYSRDAKFFDFKRLSNFYITHLTDYNFMTAFLKKFYNLQSLSQFNFTLLSIKNSFDHFVKTGLLPLGAQIIMNDFLIKYTIEKNEKGSRRNFVKLRDLTMFVVNYINENKLREKPISANKNDINEINSLITHYENLLKEENLPKEVIEAYEAAIKNLQHILNTINYNNGRSLKK